MRLQIFFAATTILACASFWLLPEHSPIGPVLDVLVLMSAISLTVFTLKQRLPTQNIFAAAALIAVIAGVAASVSPASGVPFGKVEYAARLKLFAVLPWPVPLLWVMVILNAREVARLCLQPQRRSRSYGFWLAGLAASLAVLFDLGLEPFAVKVRSYWQWPKIISATNTLPWINFLGWLVLAFGILLCLAPWFIRKRPLPEPKNFVPLWVWLSINLYLAAGNSKHHLWITVLVSLLLNPAIAILATRDNTRPRQNQADG
ncbi:MAG TPA: carotenoid biosynthesis protein [Candidatus Eisenbacteria bacterium]|jgi:putative membrane protein|nr:carotenoid biosynthesis protein [Candidatus Eisenbacteria bacterium]